MKNTKQLGGVLRIERLKRGLSLRDVAEKIHLSAVFISQVENGGACSLESVLSIGGVYGLNPDAIKKLFLENRLKKDIDKAQAKYQRDMFGEEKK